MAEPPYVIIGDQKVPYDTVYYDMPGSGSEIYRHKSCFLLDFTDNDSPYRKHSGQYACFQPFGLENGPVGPNFHTRSYIEDPQLIATKVMHWTDFVNILEQLWRDIYKGPLQESETTAQAIRRLQEFVPEDPPKADDNGKPIQRVECKIYVLTIISKCRDAAVGYTYRVTSEGDIIPLYE